MGGAGRARVRIGFAAGARACTSAWKKASAQARRWKAAGRRAPSRKPSPASGSRPNSRRMLPRMPCALGPARRAEARAPAHLPCWTAPARRMAMRRSPDAGAAAQDGGGPRRSGARGRGERGRTRGGSVVILTPFCRTLAGKRSVGYVVIQRRKPAAAPPSARPPHTRSSSGSHDGARCTFCAPAAARFEPHARSG